MSEATKIEWCEIRNIPARNCAKLVARDGKPRSVGMWFVYVVGSADADFRDCSIRVAAMIGEGME